nr:helix-turn-helix transcriptional regulator [Anaerolineae bacterium]
MTKENLSARKTAQEIGVAHTTITRILNNENIDLQTYQQVCTWLGVNPADLLHQEGKLDEVSEVAARMTALLELSPSLKQVFEEVIAKYQDGTVSMDTVKDIMAYAAYRLGLDEADTELVQKD